MNLLKKLLFEFTYRELVERIIEEELYLKLLTSNKSSNEKDLKLLHKELDRRNIKKIRKQKLEKINEVVED